FARGHRWQLAWLLTAGEAVPTESLSTSTPVKVIRRHVVPFRAGSRPVSVDFRTNELLILRQFAKQLVTIERGTTFVIENWNSKEPGSLTDPPRSSESPVERDH